MENNDFLETFHKRLKGLALQQDVMQIEVADATGIAPSSISDYFSKKGKKIPSVYTAARLAQYFGVSIDYLVGFADSLIADDNITTVMQYTGLSKDSTARLHRLLKDDKKAQIDLVDDLVYSNIADHIVQLYCNYADLTARLRQISTALSDLAAVLPADTDDITDRQLEQIGGVAGDMYDIDRKIQAAKYEVAEHLWAWANGKCAGARRDYDEAYAETQKQLDEIENNIEKEKL